METLPMPSLPKSEAQEQIEETLRQLRAISRQRRRRKTPRASIKTRPIDNKGTLISYVDRADYQRALDSDFPGWSIVDMECWNDKRSDGIPVAYHVKVKLEMVDGLIKRTMFGVGTATISDKEVSKDNTSALKFKYKAAMTEAIKAAAGWLGEFFDLRADEEGREEAEKPIPENVVALYELLQENLRTEQVKKEIDVRWKTQNNATALEFLHNLAKKLNFEIIKPVEGETRYDIRRKQQTTESTIPDR